MQIHHHLGRHRCALAASAALAIAVFATVGPVANAHAAAAPASATWAPPKPHLKPTPKPTATATPTPTPTPAPTCSPTTWNGASYCQVARVTRLTDGSYPIGSALGFTGAYVTGVNGPSVTLSGLLDCPPGAFCGATLMFEDVTVTFGPGLAPAEYGEVIDVYGRTTSGGFTVDGYDVAVPCEYALGCL